MVTIMNHGAGIIHRLNSEIYLLKYHISECKVKVWLYIDRNLKDEGLAARLSSNMRTTGELKKLTTHDIQVLNPIVKRFQDLSKELIRKQNLLELSLNTSGDVNVDKTQSIC